MRDVIFAKVLKYHELDIFTNAFFFAIIHMNGYVITSYNLVHV